MLPRIFELFTQGSPSTHDDPSRIGRGLSVVKELVELHGGTVEVRSDGSGKGADFWGSPANRDVSVFPR